MVKIWQEPCLKWVIGGLLYHDPRAWNSLPATIQETNTLRGLKNLFRIDPMFFALFIVSGLACLLGFEVLLLQLND